MAKNRAISIYEEMYHPNEEKHEEGEEEDLDPGLTDENGNRVGWTASWLYVWFSKFDEETLRPMFIRNYSREAIILEDEY